MDLPGWSTAKFIRWQDWDFRPDRSPTGLRFVGCLFTANWPVNLLFLWCPTTSGSPVVTLGWPMIKSWSGTWRAGWGRPQHTPNQCQYSGKTRSHTDHGFVFCGQASFKLLFSQGFIDRETLQRNARDLLNTGSLFGTSPMVICMKPTRTCHTPSQCGSCV